MLNQGHKTEKHKLGHVRNVPKPNEAYLTDPNYSPAIRIDAETGKKIRTSRCIHPKLEAYLSQMIFNRFAYRNAPNKGETLSSISRKKRGKTKLIRPQRIYLRRLQAHEILSKNKNGKGETKQWTRCSVAEYVPDNDNFRAQIILPAP